MQMGLEILILKKAAEYASFRMLMGISGKDPAGIYKSITLHKIKGAEGLDFLRKGGVVCDQTWSDRTRSLLGFCSVKAIFVLGFR
jgi:hypothetical protein